MTIAFFSALLDLAAARVRGQKGAEAPARKPHRETSNSRLEPLPQPAGIILDSPFSSFKQLALDLTSRGMVRLTLFWTGHTHLIVCGHEARLAPFPTARFFEPSCLTHFGPPSCLSACSSFQMFNLPRLPLHVRIFECSKGPHPTLRHVGGARPYPAVGSQTRGLRPVQTQAPRTSRQVRKEKRA